MDRELFEQIVEEISLENLADFMAAPFGQRMVIDGVSRIHIVDAGCRDADEVASVKCPGIGNLDISYYREGWDCADLSDEGVVVGCCEDGDMSEELDDLKKALLDDFQNREDAKDI